ncbi:hypothetical protein L6R50_13720 [Myxococcota bacterium]|nr:hypothetical protein [Myxococcota bacterium]
MRDPADIRRGRAGAAALAALAMGATAATAAAGDAPPIRAGGGVAWALQGSGATATAYPEPGTVEGMARVGWVFAPFAEASLRVGFQVRKGLAHDVESGLAVDGAASHLYQVPLLLGVDLRLDRSPRQPVVPYAGAGLTSVLWHEAVDGGPARTGADWGPYAVVGVGIRLVGREGAWRGRPVRGRSLADVLLNVEAVAARADSFGDGMDLSSLRVMAGLTVAFSEGGDPGRLAIRAPPPPEAPPPRPPSPPQVTGILAEGGEPRYQLDVGGEWGVVPGALLRIFRAVEVPTADGRPAPPLMHPVGWMEVESVGPGTALARLRALEPGQKPRIGDRLLGSGALGSRPATAEIRVAADEVLAGGGEPGASGLALSAWAGRMARVEGLVTVSVRLPAAPGMGEAMAAPTDLTRVDGEGAEGGEGVRLVGIERKRDAATVALEGARSLAAALAGTLGIPAERVVAMVEPPDPGGLPGGEVVVRAEGVTWSGTEGVPVPEPDRRPARKGPRKKPKEDREDAVGGEVVVPLS